MSLLINQKLAIEDPDTGNVVYTNLWQLIQWKHGIKAEMGGLKFRKSVCAHVKRQFKWKGNRQKIYDAISDTLDVVEAQMKERNNAV